MRITITTIVFATAVVRKSNRLRVIKKGELAFLLTIPGCPIGLKTKLLASSQATEGKNPKGANSCPKKGMKENVSSISTVGGCSCDS